MKLVINYDAQWKLVIEAYFEEFIAFFLPTLYPLVDFGIDPVYLDKELHELVADKITGLREGDKLVKVFLKSGLERWIFVHIEVQSYPDNEFDLRMFSYYYRIWDRYGRDIVALAIFTERHKLPIMYKVENYGTELIYKYNHYYIKSQEEKELLKSENVFAIVVLASLYSLQSKRKKAYKQRLMFKLKLIRLLLERGYSHLDIRKLFIFIQNILKLPPNLESQFKNEVKQITMVEDSRTYITEENRDLAKELYLHVHGDKASTVVEAIENLKAAAAKSKEEAVKAEKAEDKLNQQLEKSIILLFEDLGLKPEQISEKLEIELFKVNDILKKHKLL